MPTRDFAKPHATTWLTADASSLKTRLALSITQVWSICLEDGAGRLGTKDYAPVGGGSRQRVDCSAGSSLTVVHQTLVGCGGAARSYGCVFDELGRCASFGRLAGIGPGCRATMSWVTVAGSFRRSP